MAEENVGLRTARRGDDGDARLVMEWRNDPLTRAMFFSGHERTWPAFRQEFDSYFPVELPPPVFITADGQPAVFIRFEKPEIARGPDYPRDCVGVSINVGPRARGRGLAAKALRMVEDDLLRRGIRRIYAIVKESNPASARSFINAGYVELERRAVRPRADGPEIDCIIFEREVGAAP